MTLTIRPLTPDDYPAMAAIINVTERDEDVTADELRLADERRYPKCKRQVWLAERDGQAIGLTSLSQYPDFYHLHKLLYDLQWAADQDVPLPEPITPMSFEQYCRQMLHTPKLAAEGSFVAVDERAGGRYVGLSTFFHNGEGKLEVDITGVAGDYRRRGIAGAIKAQGYREISVVNDPVNVGMLRINEKMGFVRQPAIVWLTRTIDAEHPL
jgi:GNAT superfamily N-acetyltransferase